MARRRGQRRGFLFKSGPSWMLQWREDATLADGTIGRVRRCRIVADAEGPHAVSKRQAARLAWDTVLSRLDNGNSLRSQSLMPVSEFVERRFEPDWIWSLKPSGRLHYRGVLKNYVLPAIGRLRLRDVLKSDVQAMVKRVIASGKSTQTALHARNAVSAIFRHARNEGFYTGQLPSEGVRLPEMQRRERQALSWEQAKAIIEALKEPYSTLALLLAVTGLRIGEACGLRWEHVTLEADGQAVLAVRENWVLGARGTLKKASSRRNVPIPRVLYARLLGLAAVRVPSAPVFAARTGKPMDYRNALRRHLKPAAAALGLAWVSWHTFRHSQATWSETVGLTLSDRQRALGHATAAMTMHYTHSDLQRLRTGVEAIAERLSPSGGRVQ